jgi:hypothetical protein
MHTRYARGRHQPGKMNKLEAEFAQRLKIGRMAGLIQWFEFEPIKLRLADMTLPPSFIQS